MLSKDESNQLFLVNGSTKFKFEYTLHLLVSFILLKGIFSVLLDIPANFTQGLSGECYHRCFISRALLSESHKLTIIEEVHVIFNIRLHSFEG